MKQLLPLLLLFIGTAFNTYASDPDPGLHLSAPDASVTSLLDAEISAGETENFSLDSADPERNEIRIKRHQPVEMRDGTILYADLYLPKEEGQYPTIVSRTPYGVQRPGSHQRFIPFAQRGYAVVFQDTRGRFESEGDTEPFRNNARDGYDTIEWAAAQPWSNGRVAMQGGSYLGHNQWAAASQAPPSLVAIFPAVASTNLYANWITMGGAFRLAFNFGWGAVRMPNRIMLPQFWHTEDYSPEELKYENILMHLPLRTMDLESAGNEVSHYRDWVENDYLNDYWQEINDEARFDQIEVPAYNFGGWFDIFAQGTINGYTGLRAEGATPEAREGTRLRIGPWEHGASTSAGGFEFGEDAFVSQFEEEIQFYDYHLKGIDNGYSDQPPVKLFYLGAGKWVGEEDYPVPGTEYRNLYLSSQDGANSVRGDGRLSFNPPARQNVDTYRYDPDSPVPTYGGNNCCGAPTVSGPRDQREVERRQDVLVYTSDFLTEELTIAGTLRMTLHAATDGPDTDWMVKVMDVHPDGTSKAISEGMLRARFHEGLDEVNLLNPGQVYEFDIELFGIANVFKPGHRIRVMITSSNFPQFDRNPNTGEPLGEATEVRVAEQEIYTGGDRLSRLILPVVPNLDER